MIERFGNGIGEQHLNSDFIHVIFGFRFRGLVAILPRMKRRISARRTRIVVL